MSSTKARRSRFSTSRSALAATMTAQVSAQAACAAAVAIRPASALSPGAPLPVAAARIRRARWSISSSTKASKRETVRRRRHLFGERVDRRPVDLGQQADDALDLGLEGKAVAMHQRDRTPYAAVGDGVQARPVRLGDRRAAFGFERRRCRSLKVGGAEGPDGRCRQRERMVTRRRPGSALTSTNTVRAGGSSSDFSSALAALMLRSSAASTMTTRQLASSTVWPRKPRRRRTSSTRDRGHEPLCLGVVGPAHKQAGWMREPCNEAGGGAVGPHVERLARRQAIRRRRQQKAGEAISERRLADAGGSGDEPGMVHSAARKAAQQLTSAAG